MSSTSVTLQNVRFSYVNVFTPRAPLSGDGAPKYSVTILLPKTDVAGKQAIDAALAAATQDGIQKKWDGRKPPVIKTPIHDGDGVRQSGEPYGAECRGHWVFTASANENHPPQVAGPDRKPIMREADVYSGMYGAVNVNFYPYSVNGNRGIACGLNGLMKTADGEPLGGSRPSIDSMFGSVPAAPTQSMGAPLPQGYAPESDPFGLPFGV